MIFQSSTELLARATFEKSSNMPKNEEKLCSTCRFVTKRRLGFICKKNPSILAFVAIISATKWHIFYDFQFHEKNDYGFFW